MNSFHRVQTLAEVAANALKGAALGYELKDFLHEFKESPGFARLVKSPPDLAGHLPEGAVYDAFLQALAVFLSAQIRHAPPKWTQPPKMLAHPWFASPGAAMRNYLLISSPAPFRARNLFVDEDSLQVV